MYSNSTILLVTHVTSISNIKCGENQIFMGLRTGCNTFARGDSFKC